MMREAYRRGYKVQLFTTLQGMVDEDFEILQDVKFSMVVLHIPDEEENAKFVIDEEYLEHLKKFIEKYDILYYSCHGKVHPAVKSILNPKIPIASEMANRAGHLVEEHLKKHSYEQGRIVCTGGVVNTDGNAVGWTPMLLPNGMLLACCNDYGLELVLGNLYTESWEQILHSKKFSEFERGFDDDSVFNLCRKCNRVSYREDAIKKCSNIIWNNAIKVGRLFEKIENKEINAIDVLGEEKGKKINDLIFSKNVCIFGLGKLFFDTYESIPWKDVLLADKNGICSDNNIVWKEKHSNVFGLEYIEPSQLSQYEDLQVVTYVTNDSEIRKQLLGIGINKIINIYEIFDIFNEMKEENNV